MIFNSQLHCTFEYMFPYIQNHPRLTLCLIWLSAILFVNPNGGFPLNDDWAYAYSVQQLHEGNWIIHPVVLLNLIGHSLWGYLFTLPFGFSYTALRLSVLVLSFIGLLGVYQLILENTNQSKLAFWVSLLIGFNPIYFSLSFTFMTDVPFLAWCIWAWVYYIRSLKGSQLNTSIALATLFTLFALSIRQIAIFLPVAFTLFYIYHYRKFSFKILLPLLLTLIGWGIFSTIQQTLRVPIEGQYDTIGLFQQLFNLPLMGWRLFIRTGLWLLLLGLFTLPLTLSVGVTHLQALSLTTKKYTALIALPFIIASIRAFSNFPSGNIFYNLGLGPKTLSDTYLLGINDMMTTSPWLWMTLKVFALLGSILLVLSLIATFLQRTTNKSPNLTHFLGLNLLGYIPFILLFPIFFDRYTLPILVLVVLMVVVLPPSPLVPYSSREGILENKSSWGKVPPLRRLGGKLTFLLLITFSLLATKDYLNWNTVRWQAITYTQQTLNIPPTQIEGGYESAIFWTDQTEAPPLYFDYLKTFGKAKNNRQLPYRISFGKVKDYAILKKFTYQRWIPYQQSSIYILKKQ